MIDHKIDPKLDELLSAFLDGETSSEETHMLLDRLGRDPRVHSALDYHHRQRAALRGELHPGLDDGFVGRVLAGIEDTNSHTPRVVPLLRRVPAPMRAALGLAMAASIAAVAVLTVQTLLPPADSAVAALATAPDVPPADTPLTEAVAVAADAGQHWNDLSPDAAAELNNYLISHNNSAIDHGLNGTMGFMRVAADEDVGFDWESR